MSESNRTLNNKAKVQAMREFLIWFLKVEALKIWGNLLSFRDMAVNALKTSELDYKNLDISFDNTTACTKYYLFLFLHGTNSNTLIWMPHFTFICAFSDTRTNDM